MIDIAANIIANAGFDNNIDSFVSFAYYVRSYKLWIYEYILNYESL